jgi:hypothetical protein
VVRRNTPVRLQKWLGPVLGLTLFLVPALSAQAIAPDVVALFKHDAMLSELGSSSSGQTSSIYLESSGILFLSDHQVLEFLLRSNGDRLVRRLGTLPTDAYILTLSLFDVDEGRTIAQDDISVPDKTVQLFRSNRGNIILCTQSWITLLSPQLQLLHNIAMSGRFEEGYISAATDINGAHVYLSGKSAKECPQSVRVLDSESLLAADWWCFTGQAKNVFHGETAVRYHERIDSILTIYNKGMQSATITPPGLLVAAQVILLTDDLFLVNGGNLLGYSLRKGVVFSAPIIRNWNVVSPISCDAMGEHCGMALALAKPNFFDITREETYKDVLIAIVSSRDGRVLFRHSIRTEFSSPIKLGGVHIQVSLAPDGKRIAIWRGSAWEVYQIQ